MNERETAEILALQALEWAVGRASVRAALVTATGADAAALQQGAREPEVLGAILDFILADEAVLLDCAAALGIAPGRLLRARATLPGGDAPHWT